MTEVPIPQKDNSVQSLALALSKAVIAQVPVAGSLINEFIDKTNKKYIEKGHQIFLEEVSKGRVDLADHEKEAFIPIGYRYYRAASEGTVNRNLHLLAKLIRKQIEEKDLSYEKYITMDNAIRDLSMEEMIALSEICQPAHNLNDHSKQLGGIKKENIGMSYKHFVQYIIDTHNNYFLGEDDVISILSSLSGKGLATTVFVNHSGPYPTFVPTKFALSIAEKAKVIEFDFEEEQPS